MDESGGKFDRSKCLDARAVGGVEGLAVSAGGGEQQSSESRPGVEDGISFVASELALQRQHPLRLCYSHPLNMPSGIARIHGNKSNRASTAKLATVEDKVVFKSVLSNPFEVKW